MNRKSQFFSILLVLMFIIVMFTAIAVISGSSKNKITEVGPRQQEIFDAYRQGESKLFFLDTIIRKAGNEALFFFEENGHYPELGYSVYNYWKINNRSLKPEEDKGKFISILVPIVNEYMTVYSQFSTSDFDLDNGFVLLRRLWPTPITDENTEYYVFSRSAEKIGGFGYSEIWNFINITDTECSEKEYYNVIGSDDNLSECVMQKAAGSIKLMEDCESGDALKLYAFAEEYNRCADSLDYNCECEFSDIRSIRLENIGGTTIAKLGNNSVALHKPYSGLLNTKVMKTASGIEESSGNIPMCRLLARNFNICYDHNQTVLVDNYFKAIITKFAAVIDDKAAPPEIQASALGNIISWNASPAPDVMRYRVYIAQKGIPFDSDEYVAVERADPEYMNSFANYDNQFIYFSPANLGNFNVKVVAEDFSGNYIKP